MVAFALFLEWKSKETFEPKIPVTQGTPVHIAAQENEKLLKAIAVQYIVKCRRDLVVISLINVE